MKCPGQDMRYWGPDAVIETKCPTCGNSMEFFKDESTRKCKKCGRKVINPKMDFGCASYCPYADQCLGALPPELLAKRGDLLKDRVAVAMRRYFGPDARRIKHAEDVAGYAAEIGREEQGNLAVIMAVAYLHDIGIREAERKYNSSAAHHQHAEGPPVARVLLSELKADSTLMRATLLDHVTPAMRIYHEETFGPVKAIVRVKDTEEAIACANDNAYGLSAAVFGKDIARASTSRAGSIPGSATSTRRPCTTRPRCRSAG